MPIEFNNTKPYLKCKDHTYSGETFQLVYAPDYDILLTCPRPEPEELPKYYQSKDYISHTDSKKTFIDKIYQRVKSFMLQKKMKLLENYHPQKGNLLDIGTGTGDFLKEAKKRAWEIFGTEPNADARKIAQIKGINLQIQTAKFSERKFDVITMWHVLEHVPDLEKQLAELDRLLKKDGTLFVAVPNFKSYDAQYYKEFWAAYDVPRHLYHFSKEGIVKLFAKSGFEILQTLPLKFDAYYVSLLSEKHKSGRNHFLKALIIGFISNWKASSSKEYSSHIYILKRS